MPSTAPTWSQALADATSRLADAGIDEAALDAALLLGEVVGASRTLLRLHGDRLLSPEQADGLAALLARRAAREPLPYVLGWQEFYGLRLACDRRALVPRWDTECLVDWVVKRLAGHRAPRLADIGTGTGAIALSLAHSLPGARVWAIDASAEALALAAENAARLGLAARLTFAAGHLAEPLPADEEFDAVVANLPYIPRGELAGLQPEVRDWEPSSALDGGADGLDLLRELAASAPAQLAAGGALVLEHGDGQSDAVSRLLRSCGYAASGIISDLGGRPRAAWGVWQP